MIFPLASVSRPALGPTQPPVQWAPGVKARPGRDADHPPPSSAKVENEYELYLLSPQAPPWRVAGLLYLLYGTSHKTVIFILWSSECEMDWAGYERDPISGFCNDQEKRSVSITTKDSV
jgi:hypothetical protein